MHMVSTINKVMYKAFGLNIVSEIPLRELPVMNEEIDRMDVKIQREDLTKQWEQYANPKRYYVVKDNVVMFRIPGIAIFSIQDGNTITFSPMADTKEDHVRLYILGTCMGTILMQRKILPLHGSAIAINGKAYAIVGDSGAGKSTLASAFLKKGFELLSDDVIPVTLTKDRIPIVTPAYPQQKLWQESLHAFGMAAGKYKPIIDRETKFAVPVTSQFQTESLPLAGVFELVKTNSKDIKVEAIHNLHRLHTLFNHTYRNFLLAPLGLTEWHFQLTASIAQHIDVYQLQRPIPQFTANELTTLMLTTINRSEQ